VLAGYGGGQDRPRTSADGDKQGISRYFRLHIPTSEISPQLVGDFALCNRRRKRSSGSSGLKYRNSALSSSPYESAQGVIFRALLRARNPPHHLANSFCPYVNEKSGCPDRTYLPDVKHFAQRELFERPKASIQDQFCHPADFENGLTIALPSFLVC
jgi:hypothetical protein